MRRIREIVKLSWESGMSLREVAAVVGVSASTVAGLLGRVRVAGLSWPLDAGLADAMLEARLYPTSVPSQDGRRVPDWSYVHKELRRKGVTLMLLWEEYKGAHSDGYQYSQFCELYQRFANKVDVVMRQVHRAGEKAFVDWSGDGITITDPANGEEWMADVFVGVLGASNYTYAEATPSQELRFWIQVHVHMYEYFQGAPGATVPDNTKTAVAVPCRYDPEIQSTYREMAEHYGTAILPLIAAFPKVLVDIAFLDH